jgi:UDP-N-acetylmuramoylalanine--D-glutamate ligase
MLRRWRDDAVLAGNLRVSALEALPKIEADTPVVLELSSWQLEGLEEPGISPHIGAVTNLSQDHMDRYRSLEDYGAAKKLIFTHQRAERGDWAVLNADDPIVSRWDSDAPAGAAWFGRSDTCSRSPGAFIVGKDLKWCTEGGLHPTIAPVDEIGLPGVHNLYNAACAATMAILAGAPFEAVHLALRDFKGVADRMEYLATLDGVRFYNDTTSTTPASTIAALNALDPPIVLIAGGAAKGLDFSELGTVVSERAHAVALLEGTATDLMERQFRDAGANILGRYDDFPSAVREAWEAAPPGGTVLLSPATASFGMFTNEFHRGERFRAIVADLVENPPSRPSEA